MNPNKKRKNKYFITRYYYDKTNTLLLIFFFVTLFLVIILQNYSIFSIKQAILNTGVEGFVSLASGIYSLLIISVIGFIYSLLNKYITTTIEPESLDGVEAFVIDTYNEKIIIPRIELYKRLMEFFKNTIIEDKYGFIVGKSGSGKSTLLKQFVTEYDKPNHKVRRFEAGDYINVDVLERELKKSQKSVKKIT